MSSLVIVEEEEQQKKKKKRRQKSQSHQSRRLHYLSPPRHWRSPSWEGGGGERGKNEVAPSFCFSSSFFFSKKWRFFFRLETSLTFCSGSKSIDLSLPRALPLPFLLV